MKALQFFLSFTFIFGFTAFAQVPTHTIAQVQGSGTTSPVTGQVTIEGIVTGVKSNGFFLQTPDGLQDADINTSEGIFIYSSPLSANAAIGNKVSVTGTVTEYIPTNDVNSPPLTEITTATVSLINTGNPLPVPVIITSAQTNPAGGIDQLEKYEGMRVQVNSLTVSGPTEGTITESSGNAVSTGRFYGVVTGISNPFRETGVQIPDPLPAGAPANVPRWDANPEVLAIYSKTQPGSVSIDVNAGAIVTNIIGPLDYLLRTFAIHPDAATPPTVSNNNLTYLSAPASSANEVSVASINLKRFFDTNDDPGITEPILTTVAFNNRLNKASLAIRNVLSYADVIGTEEVENLSALQAIANKLNNDAIALGLPSPAYRAYLTEGNDIGGIDVGFLVKTAKITVVSVTQFGKTATYVNPLTGTNQTLYDRPPLVLVADFNKPGVPQPIRFTVIVNHHQSFLNITDPTNGPRVRAKRKAQAEYLANLIQGRQTADANEKIITVGDFNAYEFNDGLTDVIGTIKGSPVPADQVVLPSADLVNPNLVNLTDTYPAAERYSYRFTGNASVLDHFLVSNNTAGQVMNYTITKLGADFPVVYGNDPNRPERLTDHNAPVAVFYFITNTISAPTDYFRSISTGNWNTNATWQSSPDNISWIPATLTPDFNANIISIRISHTVSVTANVTADQTVVETGGSVIVNPGINFTVK